MLVKDVLDLVKLQLSNIALSKNENAMIKLIYLAESELYRKFNLAVKSETIRTNPRLAQYQLRNTDVALILSLYDETGKELQESDVVNATRWDYKKINYRSFVLNHPKDGVIYAVYKASPIVIADPNDELDIPDAMINALLLYVAHMCHSTISTMSNTGGRGISEADSYLQKFTQACMELEMQGYKIPISSESLSVLAKGYA